MLQNIAIRISQKLLFAGSKTNPTNPIGLSEAGLDLIITATTIRLFQYHSIRLKISNVGSQSGFKSNGGNNKAEMLDCCKLSGDQSALH